MVSFSLKPTINASNNDDYFLVHDNIYMTPTDLGFDGQSLDGSRILSPSIYDARCFNLKANLLRLVSINNSRIKRYSKTRVVHSHRPNLFHRGHHVMKSPSKEVSKIHQSGYCETIYLLFRSKGESAQSSIDVLVDDIVAHEFGECQKSQNRDSNAIRERQFPMWSKESNFDRGNHQGVTSTTCSTF